MNIENLKILSAYLAVHLVFTVFFLRAVFFTFIERRDPIKTIIPTPKWILKRRKYNEATKKLEEQA